MKWIGQHIWSFISRFRSDIYIENNVDTSDYAKIEVGENGETTITTNDGGGSAAHLNFSVNGNTTLDTLGMIKLDAASFGLTEFQENGTSFAQFGVISSTSTFTMYEAGGASTSDLFKIGVSANGATEISTVDAAGAAAHLTFTVDGDIIFKDSTTTLGTIDSSSVFMKQTKVTLSESDCNDLHNTPVTLVAAPGANKIIVPVNYLLLVDRDASTAQGESNCDMMISYDGSTTGGKYLGYMRRFMYNETGDRTYVINGNNSTSTENWDTNDPSNKPLKIAFDSQCTNGSLDSIVVYTTYYVVDNS